MTTPPSGPPGPTPTTEEQRQQELLELLVRSNAEQAKRNELLRERAEILKMGADALEEQTRLQTSISTKLLGDVGTLADINASLESIATAESAIDALISAATGEKKKQLELQKAEIDAANDLLKIKIRIAGEEKTLREFLVTSTDDPAGAQIRRDALQQANAIKADFLNLQGKVKGVSEKVANSMGLANNFASTKLGKTTEIFSRFKQMNGVIEGGVAKGLKSVVGQTFNFHAIIAQVVEEIFKIGVALDDASKKLGADTGFGNVFQNQLLNIHKAGNMAGIGVEQASAAISALSENVSSFNPNADEANSHMGLTVARLQKLGVAAGQSAKTIDILQRTMGMTSKQAANTTAQLALMGKEIGVSGTKMINDFNAASGRLAIYGKNNIKVFKDLAAQAKATGIEMGTLLSISEKFDQFDSAADSAAKLNAVLGTQLSTLELMNATDSERVMMIKQQVQSSVGNFDSLDKFTKMYIQQAMGVKDVAEAQRLLNMSTAEYQKYKQGQQEQADIQATMAERTEELVPVMDQLKLAITEVALAFAPLISLVASALKFITPVIAFVIKWTAKLAPLIFMLYAGFQAFTAFTAGAATLLTPVGWVIAAIAALGVVLDQLFDIFHLSGSPMLYQMFDFIAGAVTRMAAAFLNPITMVKALADGFKSMFGALHDENASQSFDIAAVANVDMDKVAAGITKVKSALAELSSVKVSGMVAMTTDGTNTSMIMGSVATEMAMLLSGGKLEVDVKIPEMRMPEINVKVYIGDRELRDIIRTEVTSVVGAAG